MIIKKVDRRMNGNEWFGHVVNFVHNEIPRFVECREWAWTSFGPSCELENLDKSGKENLRWCWSNTKWDTRLYFQTDQELNWFKLTWGVK